MTLDKKTGYDPLSVVVIFAGLAAAVKYLHDLARMFFLERNFADFAFLYFLSDLLNKGINFVRLDQAAVAKLAADSAIPLHIAGYKAGTMFYSPVFFAFTRFFAKLDFVPSLLAWTALNNAACAASVILLMKISNVRFDMVRVAAVSVLVFLFQPLIETVGLGQFDLLVLLMLALALWAAVSSRDIAAGFFMALAALMKPQYALIWPLFLVKRLYRAFFSAAVFYLFFMLLSPLMTGMDPLRDYCGGIVRILTFVATDKVPWSKNLSFVSALTRLFGGGQAAAVAAVYVLFAAVAIYFLSRRVRGGFDKETFPLEFSSWLGVIFCLLPMLTENYLVLMYIPVLLIFFRIGSESRPRQYVFIAAVLLLASRYSLERFSVFSSGMMSVFANGKLLGLMLLSSLALGTNKLKGQDGR